MLFRSIQASTAAGGADRRYIFIKDSTTTRNNQKKTTIYSCQGMKLRHIWTLLIRKRGHR